MFVLSVAGSGKTMVLTERVIHLIEQGFDPARLLAITFAKKAVLEIQSRLKKRLNGNGDKALVGTFHSLGLRILKAENSLGAGCRLVHDTDQLNLVRYAMEKVKVEEDPALIMSKISLAKNDLISHNRKRVSKEMITDNGQKEEIVTDGEGKSHDHPSGKGTGIQVRHCAWSQRGDLASCKLTRTNDHEPGGRAEADVCCDD